MQRKFCRSSSYKVSYFEIVIVNKLSFNFILDVNTIFVKNVPWLDIKKRRDVSFVMHRQVVRLIQLEN